MTFKNWLTYTDSVQVNINDECLEVDIPKKLTSIIKRTYYDANKDGTFALYCETCDKMADIIRKKTHTDFRHYFVLYSQRHGNLAISAKLEIL